jgi:hypothetical protein
VIEWKKISSALYGGEPLLNSDVAYASMRYVRELEKQGRFCSQWAAITLSPDKSASETDVMNE